MVRTLPAYKPPHPATLTFKSPQSSNSRHADMVDGAVCGMITTAAVGRPALYRHSRNASSTSKCRTQPTVLTVQYCCNAWQSQQQQTDARVSKASGGRTPTDFPAPLQKYLQTLPAHTIPLYERYFTLNHPVCLPTCQWCPLLRLLCPRHCLHVRARKSSEEVAVGRFQISASYCCTSTWLLFSVRHVLVPGMTQGSSGTALQNPEMRPCSCPRALQALLSCLQTPLNRTQPCCRAEGTTPQ